LPFTVGISLALAFTFAFSAVLTIAAVSIPAIACCEVCDCTLGISLIALV
jgi:hypothetical protein